MWRQYEGEERIKCCPVSASHFWLFSKKLLRQDSRRGNIYNNVNSRTYNRCWHCVQTKLSGWWRSSRLAIKHCYCFCNYNFQTKENVALFLSVISIRETYCVNYLNEKPTTLIVSPGVKKGCGKARYFSQCSRWSCNYRRSIAEELKRK